MSQTTIRAFYLCFHYYSGMTKTEKQFELILMQMFSFGTTIISSILLKGGFAFVCQFIL